MAPTTPTELRERLLEIDDELTALSPDEFARKYELLTEADDLRSLLEEHAGPELEAARKRWADRANRAGGQDMDPAEAKANRVILAATHGGVGGGSG